MVICSRHLNTDISGDDFTKKRGKNKCTCPMFDDEFLAASKQLKLFSRYFIFPIKQEDICYYNPQCFYV